MTESISSSSATPYEQAALKMKDRSIKAKEDELRKKATSVFGGYSKNSSVYHYYNGNKEIGKVLSNPAMQEQKLLRDFFLYFKKNLKK